jgi:hypothetical protein
MADKTESEDRRAWQRDVVVEELGHGRSYRAAAAAAGINAKTVQRWMTDPAFRRRVSERREEFLNGVTGQLASLALQAVAVIGAELTGEQSATRIQAARLALSELARYRHVADTDDRLNALEVELGLRAGEGP